MEGTRPALTRRSSLWFPQADRTAIRCGRKKLRYGLVLDRMARCRRDFRQRRQNESPLSHARMRNFEVWRADDARAAQQNIEINHSRSAAHQTAAADFIFDLVNRAQKLARHQIRLRLDCAIQKPILRLEVHWFSQINRRPARHTDAVRLQGSNSRREMLRAVADIRP